MKKQNLVFALAAALLLSACSGNNPTPSSSSASAPTSSSAPASSQVSSSKETPAYFSVILPSGNHYKVAAVEGYNASNVLKGSSFKFTVTVDTGYAVTEVKANDTALIASDNVYTITNIQQNTVVSVAIECNIVSINLPTGPNFTVKPVEGYDPENIIKGSDFRFTVEAAEHYHVVSVTADEKILMPADGVYTIEKVEDDSVELAVTVAEDTYALTMTESSYYDIAVLSEGIDLQAVKYSEEVRFTVTAKEHCFITKVLLNNEEITAVENVYTVKNLAADGVVTVEFAKETFVITLPTSEAYTVAAVEGYDASSVEYGSDFRFTVTPAANHKIKAVKAGDAILEAVEGVYVIENVATNLTISVEDVAISEILSAAVSATDAEFLADTDKATAPEGYGTMKLYSPGSKVRGFFQNVSLYGIDQLDFYVYATSSSDALFVNTLDGVQYGMWASSGAIINATRTENGWTVTRKNGKWVTLEGSNWGSADSYTVSDAKYLAQLFHITTGANEFAISEIYAEGTLHVHQYNENHTCECGQVNLLPSILNTEGLGACTADPVGPTLVTEKIGNTHGEWYTLTPANKCFTYNIFNSLDISAYSEISFTITAGTTEGVLWLTQGEDNLMANAHGGTWGYNKGYDVFYIYEITAMKTETGWTVYQTNNRNTGFITNSYADEGASYNVDGATKINELFHFGSYRKTTFITAIEAK